MSKRHGVSLLRRDQNIAQCLNVATFSALQAKLDGIAGAALDGRADIEPADADFHHIHHVANAQSVTREGQTIGQHFNVGFALHPGCGHPHGPGNRSYNFLDAVRHLLNGIEIVAENLDPDLGANAGAKHEQAVLDGLEKTRHVSGHEAEFF